MAVNGVRKHCSDKEVVSLAKVLIKNWKRLLGERGQDRWEMGLPASMWERPCLASGRFSAHILELFNKWHVVPGSWSSRWCVCRCKIYM